MGGMGVVLYGLLLGFLFVVIPFLSHLQGRDQAYNPAAASSYSSTSWDGGSGWGQHGYGYADQRDWSMNTPAMNTGSYGMDRHSRPLSGVPSMASSWQSGRNAAPMADHRSLNKELVKFYRLAHIQRFCAENINNFNAVNLGTAFHHIGLLAKKAKGKQKESVDMKVLDMLANQAMFQVAEFDPQGLTNIFWAYGMMGVTPKPQVFSALSKRAVATLSNMKGQVAANMMWAVAKMGIEPEGELVSALTKRSIKLAAEFSPTDLSNFMWGLATLNLKNKSHLIAAINTRVNQIADQFKANDLSQTLWGYATLELELPSDVVLNVMNRAKAMFKDFNQTSVVNFLWACAKLELSPEPDIVSGVLQKLIPGQPKERKPPPQRAVDVKEGNEGATVESADVAASEGAGDGSTAEVKFEQTETPTKADDGAGKGKGRRNKKGGDRAPGGGDRAPGGGDRASGGGDRTPGGDRAQGGDKVERGDKPEPLAALDLQLLSTLLWAMGRLGAQPSPEVAKLLEDKTISEFLKEPDAELKPPNLITNLVWAFGKMSRELGSDNAEKFAEKVSRRALALKSHFKPAEIASFLWGSARLGITVDPGLLKEFLDQISGKIAYLKAHDISNLLGTFAMLCLESQNELTLKLVKHSVSLTEKFAPHDMAQLLWSLAVLSLACPEIPLFVQTVTPLTDRMAKEDKALLHQFILSCTLDDKIKACCTPQVLEGVAGVSAECRECFIDSTASDNEALVSALQGAVTHAMEKSVVDGTTGYFIGAVIQDGSGVKGCAVLPEGRKSFIQLSSGMRLSTMVSQMKKKHLTSLGFRVVSVPFWEWEECALVGPSAQSEYLNNKLSAKTA